MFGQPNSPLYLGRVPTFSLPDDLPLWALIGLNLLIGALFIWWVTRTQKPTELTSLSEAWAKLVEPLQEQVRHLQTEVDSLRSRLDVVEEDRNAWKRRAVHWKRVAEILARRLGIDLVAEGYDGEGQGVSRLRDSSLVSQVSGTASGKDTPE